MSGCEDGRGGGGELTHVQPFSAALDHALAFCGELAKVGGEDGGGDDRAGHSELVDEWEPERASERIWRAMNEVTVQSPDRDQIARPSEDVTWGAPRGASGPNWGHRLRAIATRGCVGRDPGQPTRATSSAPRRGGWNSFSISHSPLTDVRSAANPGLCLTPPECKYKMAPSICTSIQQPHFDLLRITLLS